MSPWAAGLLWTVSLVYVAGVSVWALDWWLLAWRLRRAARQQWKHDAMLRMVTYMSGDPMKPRVPGQVRVVLWLAPLCPFIAAATGLALLLLTGAL